MKFAATERIPVCRHRGSEFAPSRWSCCSPKLIVPLGTDRATCRQCPYVDHPAEAGEPPAVVADFPHGRDGVVIGTFDTLQNGHRYGVSAVRLNLAVLRARCGWDLKVLVCDDASPPESQREYRSVCDEFEAEFSSNTERWGHTSGDMVVFYKAITWAAEMGLRTVTKLSHRLVIDAPHWVREDADMLLASGHSTCAQMLTNFPTDQVRTEGVMMVTRDWATPEVLEHYRPRKIFTWNEGHTFQAIRELVGRGRPYPGFLPWPRLSFLRGADEPPVYFRVMRGTPQRHYHELAERYRVSLPGGFSTEDSILSDDYVS